MTPDETGLAHYGRDDFARALRSGLRPDGSAISAPMPLFRGLDDTEVDALLAYLKTLPARKIEGAARTRPGRAVAVTASTPRERFQSLGCVHCHGPGAQHESALSRAGGKETAALARWIRNPEQYLPGTPMPTYAGVLDERSALELATWIKDGGPRTQAP